MNPNKTGIEESREIDQATKHSPPDDIFDLLVKLNALSILSEKKYVLRSYPGAHTQPLEKA